MKFTDLDIDFRKVTPSQFEELCYDLVSRSGFYALKWRRGGADSGRDIEATLRLHNAVVGTIEERWFFECKHYTSGGVPPDDLTSKIAWADAEQPDHLVFFMSSYPTNPARDWLKKIEVQKSYRLHVVEEKDLKDLLLAFPDLVEKYFASAIVRLLRSIQDTWVAHGLPPDSGAIDRVLGELDIANLALQDVAFLWGACLRAKSDPPTLSRRILSLKPYIIGLAGADRSVFNGIVMSQEKGKIAAEFTLIYKAHVKEHIMIESDFTKNGSTYEGGYSLALLTTGEVIEVLSSKDGSFGPLVVAWDDGKDFFVPVRDRLLSGIHFDHDTEDIPDGAEVSQSHDQVDLGTLY
ncbi:restriction endonuclease [Burkholderia cenocepacia]|uniref:restriction endonuclease n=1 Tax=Burkholderia cenocepacia TaxID=95486 RepID=UPI00264A6F86|nr:restriction endonuclease [Burkholderia cenocepacia]MDN7826023.1 restriction endonuclease [Burkholderia cenocepacia]HEM9002629.1 restriction endonuclease [Burkholderia cenocepacia]